MTASDTLFIGMDVNTINYAIDDEIFHLKIDINEAEIARIFAARVFPNSLNSNTPQYWKSFKREFCLFINLDDKKYEERRSKLMAVAERSEIIIIATIASAIGAQLGMAWGALVPFCAAFLKELFVVGNAAFISSYCISNLS